MATPTTQEEWLQRELDRRFASTDYWLIAAENLYEAALLLWRHWRKEIESLSRRGTRARPRRMKFSDGIPKMLSGMAIEDLLKAIVVGQKKTPSTSHHDLRRLSRYHKERFGCWTG